MSGHTVWASSRLQYLPIDPSFDDFFLKSMQDATGWTNAAPFLATPQGSKKQIAESREWMEKSLLGVVVCLPAPPASETPATTGSQAEKTADGKAPEKPGPTPIGYLSLNPQIPGLNAAHHRNAMIGLGFLPEYQGKGYGSEAIRWTLWWGFRYANLHRIEIGGFGYNSRALALYERLGFKVESRKREAIYFDGRYWDLIDLGMLRREWEELYGNSDGKKTLVSAVQDP